MMLGKQNKVEKPRDVSTGLYDWILFDWIPSREEEVVPLFFSSSKPSLISSVVASERV